jgi:hypothetical protein
MGLQPTRSLNRRETTLYNDVEFELVKSVNNDPGQIFIAPPHVVTVSPFDLGRQTPDTLITLDNGLAYTVQGPPSEVRSRLRRGQ